MKLPAEPQAREKFAKVVAGLMRLSPADRKEALKRAREIKDEAKIKKG